MDILFIYSILIGKIFAVNNTVTKFKRYCFFGYLGSKKGVDILIKSFAELISVNSEYKNIKLYICGGIPEGGKKQNSIIIY